MKFLPEVGLDGRFGSVSAVDVVQAFECRFGPDTETAHVATWRYFQQVQTVDVQQGYACFIFRIKNRIKYNKI